MKTIASLLIISLLVYGCSRDNNNILDSYFVGEIVSFDMNCATCVLKFPNDSLTIKHEIGVSRDNYYNTVNMVKDTFKINQKVIVKLRKPNANEYRNCRMEYISYDYTKIYITDFKPFKYE